MDELRSTHTTLHNRMAKCGSLDHYQQNTFYCRTTGCPDCKRRYRRRQQKLAQEALGHASKADLSFVTIVFDVTGPFADIRDIWDKGRQDLKNRLKALKRESARWGDVQVMGWLEADPVTYDMVAILGSEQRELIDGLRPVLGDRVSWVVHMHAIVHHPRLDWQEVRDGFAQQWTHPRAVDVQSCAQSRFDWQEDAHTALHFMTGYALKYRAGRMISGGMDYLPPAWLADYHTALIGFSQNHQSLRFTSGLRRGAMSDDESSDVGEADTLDHDAAWQSYDSDEDWDEEDDSYGFIL